MSPTFDYSQKSQELVGVGPIPEGEYWINPAELQKNSFRRVMNPTDAWGNSWITVHPYPDTKTGVRGGFFIHGGASRGSAGCIDLTKYIDAFVSDLKAELESAMGDTTETRSRR
jgi:hypothetical protein